MSEAAAKLLEQMLSLPEDDRLMVADRLWGSVDEPDLPEVPQHFTTEAEAEAAWEEERNRRLDEIADGTADLLPWDEAMTEMRVELARRRAARQNGARS